MLIHPFVHVILCSGYIFIPLHTEILTVMCKQVINWDILSRRNRFLFRVQLVSALSCMNKIPSVFIIFRSLKIA